VDEGRLTFEAEGQEHGGPEPSEYHSIKPHQPLATSGITIGRGLDLGHFDANDALMMLDILYMEGLISEYEHFHVSDVIGLRLTYAWMDSDVARILDDRGVNFEALEPQIQDVLVDLRFRGD
jgi:hypothetical protein